MSNTKNYAEELNIEIEQHSSNVIEIKKIASAQSELDEKLDRIIMKLKNRKLKKASII